jgi:hypothetical protein
MPKHNTTTNYLKVVKPDDFKKNIGINNIEIVGKLVTKEKFINGMIRMTLEIVSEMDNENNDYDNDNEKFETYLKSLRRLG